MKTNIKKKVLDYLQLALIISTVLFAWLFIAGMISSDDGMKAVTRYYPIFAKVLGVSFAGFILLREVDWKMSSPKHYALSLISGALLATIYSSSYVVNSYAVWKFTEYWLPWIAAFFVVIFTATIGLNHGIAVSLAISATMIFFYPQAAYWTILGSLAVCIVLGIAFNFVFMTRWSKATSSKGAIEV